MKAFFALIDRLNAAPLDVRPAIEQFIWDSFARELAVLALDMSSFSLAVRRNGVLSHLCQIRRMQVLTAPLVKSHGGELLKFEADNMLAVFEHADEAIDAALAINAAIAAGDVAPAHDPPLAVSIGIDFGKLLLLPGEDCFGDPVNVAHKLGEDVARPGEILVTERVRDRLDPSPRAALEPCQLSLSGVEVAAYRVLS